MRISGNTSTSWQLSAQRSLPFTPPLTALYPSPSASRINTTHNGRSRRDRRGAVSPLICSAVVCPDGSMFGSTAEKAGAETPDSRPGETRSAEKV